MADLNRSAFLPAQISSEIIAGVQTDSAVMALARQIPLPGTGVAVPVITGDPEAAWVAETGKKPVSNSEVTSKLLQPYKIAVIETVSKELLRDANGLYNALAQRLPKALATAFDNTIVGGTSVPGSNFDTFATATAQSIGTDAYGALVDADADIAAHGGIMDGIALAPQGKNALLKATDSTGRPLFINNVAEGAVPVVLGAKTVLSKGIYKNDTNDILGVAGDWTQAVYGIVEGIQISVSDQATVGNINLWEQNMVAIRAEMEIGFRANVGAFNLITE